MWKTNETKPTDEQRVLAIHHNGKRAVVGQYDVLTDEVIDSGWGIDWEDVVWWCEYPVSEAPPVVDLATIRNAVADYMATEGECCEWCERENDYAGLGLARLLGVPFERGDYDFRPFITDGVWDGCTG